MVQSYDPDDDDAYIEPDVESGVQLDEDVVAIDAERALDLLDLITRDLPGGGESREGQRQMVRSVATALSRRESAVIEAGTGIGKSLAYLVPAAMSGQRVVIATATKNLQDQLAGKDAPMVAAHAPGVRVAVLKGKQNYLCRNRAQSVSGAAQLSSTTARTCPRASPTRCAESFAGRATP
jgi:Rad3-related DNA helicase